MNLTPIEFLEQLHSGKTEKELNMKENIKTIEELKKDGMHKTPCTLKYLVRYRNFKEPDAAEYLNTDYSNGFTICTKCGSCYNLGKGFTKTTSEDCIHCAPEKHRVHLNNNTTQIFNDGMFYLIDKLEKEKYKDYI